MQKILKRFFIIILLTSVIFLVVIVSILWTYSNKLPDYKYLKSYKPPVSSKLYSGNGVLVSDFSTEKRIFIPYNAISETVINAFLSAEDKNFFEHLSSTLDWPSFYKV
jgi:Membrane carboxypeptidase/penicillin-binding protein